MGVGVALALEVVLTVVLLLLLLVVESDVVLVSLVVELEEEEVEVVVDDVTEEVLGGGTSAHSEPPVKVPQVPLRSLALLKSSVYVVVSEPAVTLSLAL